MRPSAHRCETTRFGLTDPGMPNDERPRFSISLPDEYLERLNGVAENASARGAMKHRRHAALVAGWREHGRRVASECESERPTGPRRHAAGRAGRCFAILRFLEGKLWKENLERR